jgi:hemoglobin
MEKTIYEEIGGATAIQAAVDGFYEKVWSDPDLVSYFKGVDPDKLKRHQRAFMTTALGGPRPYTGRKMNVAHAGLAVTDEAFDRVVEHLVETLSELGVAAEIIEQIGAALAPLRADIVEVSAARVA